MQIFKFGGVSVKDAKGVKNLAGIVSSYEAEKIVIVVSAMGKTTNKLEELVKQAHAGDDYTYSLEELKGLSPAYCGRISKRAS